MLLTIALLEYPFNTKTYEFEEVPELNYLELLQSVLTGMVIIIIIYIIFFNGHSYLIDTDRELLLLHR